MKLTLFLIKALMAMTRSATQSQWDHKHEKTNLCPALLSKTAPATQLYKHPAVVDEANGVALGMI